MEKESRKKKRVKRQRQDWNPHWSLKILYGLWMTVLAAAKIALGAVATVLMIVLVCGFVFVGILGEYLEKDVLPESANYEFNVSDLEQTSNMYYVDSSGNIQLLQELHTVYDREWVEYEDIPENLINAAIAIEDKRFYEHQGVDWITTVKACINMFMGGDSQFGGSTITQQLIKNDTGDKSITVQRKVMEIFRAQYAEKLYEKDTIMEYYLNYIYFGRGCYGVKSAAEEYFGKELKSLTIAECASLISITNNPSLYNPYRTSLDKGDLNGAERNRVRQLNTLDQMLEQELITQEEYDEAVAQEMVFKSGIAEEDKWEYCDNTSCDYEGVVASFNTGNGYYCPQCGTHLTIGTNASQEVYSYFVDTVLEDVAKDLAKKNGVDWDSLDSKAKIRYKDTVSQSGFSIYTTLDKSVQDQVDRIYENLAEIPTTRSSQQPQSAIVVIDNRTGDVVALKGGVGTDKVHDGYNRAVDAPLQTGSVQKPLSVYAPAFESGEVNPATVLKDLPISYTEGAYPKNDGGKYSYSRTVLNGITYSVNTISCRTLGLIGFQYSYDYSRYLFNLEGMTDRYEAPSGRIMNDLDYSPLAMGALTLGVSVKDVTAAYATFANNGVWREARTYTKVYDSEGNIVLDNTQDSNKILSEKAVNYMNYTLFNAANNGTGGAAVFAGQNIAGKTGTTSSNRDRWFAGYTTHYTAAVWFGYDTPEEIFLTGSTANPAARLWKKVMQPIHQGLERVAIYNGAKFTGVNVCLDSGLRATAACSQDARGENRVSSAYVYAEDVPRGTCDKHVLMDYCVTGEGVATEYCSKFEDVEITQKALVKLNKSEVEEIKRAKGKGLLDVYTQDGYVYYTDGDWHGFANDHPDNTYSYLPCPVHTQEAFEKMEEEKRIEEEKKKQEEEEKKRQEEEEKKRQEEEAAKATEPAAQGE